jgi:hypothetical protein
MSKFTQKQLEEAWEQMQADRKADAQKAQTAAKWIQDQLGFGNCAPTLGHWHGHEYGPYPAQYQLVLVHETYGPYIKDYTDALAKQSWAVSQGTNVQNPVYSVTTPQGVYTLTFEYYNHWSGY